jgi:hypothetical protein
MALRASKPEAIQKRLKLFMFGTAGAGKTMAAIQFPRPYIIDCERGTENYDRIINAAGGVVLHTSDMTEITNEVKALLAEKHEYRTLVIDPITAAWNDLLEKAEKTVGTAHGRHYGEANKGMKRLANLILRLDMNVIITSHAKTEYGENQAKLGITFDAWKNLDYWFDLVLEIARTKRGNVRTARVVKTRLDSFPDGDTFDWSYESVKQRYAAEVMERQAASMELASADQIDLICELLKAVRLPDGTVEKWFAKAGVDQWEDMPAEVLAKCIDYVQARVPGGNRRTAHPTAKQGPATPAPAPVPAPPAPAPATPSPTPAPEPKAAQEATGTPDDAFQASVAAEEFIAAWLDVMVPRGCAEPRARELLSSMMVNDGLMAAGGHLGDGALKASVEWRKAALDLARTGKYDRYFAPPTHGNLFPRAAAQ